MKKNRSEKRVAVSRITMRFTPQQMARLHAAVSKTTEPWRGLSYHLRAALLTWADAMVSPAADARMRPVGRKPAQGKKREAADRRRLDKNIKAAMAAV